MEFFLSGVICGIRWLMFRKGVAWAVAFVHLEWYGVPSVGGTGWTVFLTSWLQSPKFLKQPFSLIEATRGKNRNMLFCIYFLVQHFYHKMHLQAGFFPARPQDLLSGNSKSHRKSFLISSELYLKV